MQNQNIVQKLNSNLINQIAAGEVVDSPSAIVKELIENSIDAKAGNIKLFIYKSGNNKIIIKDDGIGMSSEDLNESFNRFSTSKIKNISDLNKIDTLGFRGEALPSISSISNIRASSIINGNPGSELIINNGSKSQIKPSDISTGTEIIVSNIFHNIPARKKFLKSEAYEFRKIIKVVKQFSLCYPNINFLLYHNDKKIIDLKKSNLKNRIIEIFGSNYKNNLLDITFVKDKIKVSGYVGNLSIVTKRKTNQYIFINKRYISNKLIDTTIHNSFYPIIQRGEYPFFVIFLDIPPETFDINVHPKKLQVKFSNELQIQYVIKRSIANKLKNIPKVISDYYTYSSENNIDNVLSLPFDNKLNNNYSSNIDLITESDDDQFVSHSLLASKKTWQIHNKYILTEIKSGLVIIDQHVAHERVLYESAKQALEGDGLNSQKILFPQTIKYDYEDFTYLLELTLYLQKIGFDIRKIGDTSIIIEGVPSELPIGKEKEIINDILDNYIQNKKINSSFIEYMAATYACKAAIKAGDKLSDSECSELIDQLFNTKYPFFCPHGRPIIINLSIEDLDKRFERI